MDELELKRNDSGTLDVVGENFGIFMTYLAGRIKKELAEPATASQRLALPMNPELDDDDPLARLERDSSIEATCDLVASTGHAATISLETAGAWLRVVTIASALFAANLGVETSQDRAALSEEDEGMLGFLGHLQFVVACAIDPSLDPAVNPGLYSGMDLETGEIEQ